jgi:hypothetical protein
MSIFDIDNESVISSVNLTSDAWVKVTSIEGEWVKTIQVNFDAWSWTYVCFTFRNGEVRCEYNYRKKNVSSIEEIRKFIERQTANIQRAHERNEAKRIEKECKFL